MVFLTRSGQCWCNRESGDNAISSEFRKAVKELGSYRKNVTTLYTLRRTFETIAAASGEQVAVDYIMGHIPATADMASVYRQKTYNEPLQKVSNFVREWFIGERRIE